VKGIYFNETFGAFYNTIVFKENALKPGQKLHIENPEVRTLVEEWVAGDHIAPDKRFVYYLLGAKGICVVPISSFCSELNGFRITLLENDEEILVDTFSRLADALNEYLGN
jgi:alanine-synthesizing transaminase